MAHVEAELERLQTLLDLQKQIETRSQTLTAAEGVYNNNLTHWRNSYNTLRTLLPTAPATLIADAAIAPPEADIKPIHDTLAQLETMLPALQTRIDLAEKQVSQYNALKTHLQTIDDLTETTVETQALAACRAKTHQATHWENCAGQLTANC